MEGALNGGITVVLVVVLCRVIARAPLASIPCVELEVEVDRDAGARAMRYY